MVVKESIEYIGFALFMAGLPDFMRVLVSQKYLIHFVSAAQS